MAKNKKSTGEYDENGDLEEAEAFVVPPPGIAPAGVPAGLPPEAYMTAQEVHVAEGGEYAPPEEAPEPEATSKKSKKEEKY
jgi:hypothetical protein